MSAQGNEKQFTAEIDQYVVLKLQLAQFQDGGRELPAGFELAEPDKGERVAAQERRLLKRYFRNWKAPYRGRLEGWRPDSRLLVLREGRLVGGVYLCAANEFDDDRTWGQLHYAFMDPACKGQGIYSALFRAAVLRARAWGLAGLDLNSDRHLLPQVYERWGAVHWRTVPKPSRPPRSSVLSRLRAGLLGRR